MYRADCCPCPSISHFLFSAFCNHALFRTRNSKTTRDLQAEEMVWVAKSSFVVFRHADMTLFLSWRSIFNCCASHWTTKYQNPHKRASSEAHTNHEQTKNFRHCPLTSVHLSVRTKSQESLVTHIDEHMKELHV